MKKNKLLSMILFTAALTACTAGNTAGDRGNYEAPEETPAPTVEAEVEAAPEATPTEAAEETPTPTETAANEEKSIFAIWEYSGYLDEAYEYLLQDEFIDKDYDGDGIVDRVFRQWIKDDQTAIYTIDFGNGRELITPAGWETGFPHVQTGDLTGDGEVEVLFTLSYDTSTDPMSFGEMWLFGYDNVSYKEMPLPLGNANDQSGSKCLDLDYSAPDGNKITVTVAQNGFTAEAELDEDYLNNYWLGDLTRNGYSEERVVWSAEIKANAVHCSVQPFFKCGDTIEFDLYYNGKSFDIKDMKYIH